MCRSEQISSTFFKLLECSSRAGKELKCYNVLHHVRPQEPDKTEFLLPLSDPSCHLKFEAIYKKRHYRIDLQTNQKPPGAHPPQPPSAECERSMEVFTDEPTIKTRSDLLKS